MTAEDVEVLLWNKFDIYLNQHNTRKRKKAYGPKTIPGLNVKSVL
jgi:hypothetical protein